MRVRSLLWSVPITVTFTDVVASIIRVDGASMQPTLNPRSDDSSSGAAAAASGAAAAASGAPHGKENAAAAAEGAAGGGGGGGRGGGGGAGRVPAGGRDWVLVEKWSVKVLHRYGRGDVVVLWAPDAPHQQIVKRVIGLPGDTLAVPGAAPVTVPEGRCWVEGDNAAESLDSRSAYGPVHLGLLEGRVAFVVWPPSRARRVPAAVPPGRVLHAAGAGDGAGAL